jgi:CRISPR/Cas system-associated endonuclease/helicase Cas3
LDKLNQLFSATISRISRKKFFKSVKIGVIRGDFQTNVWKDALSEIQVKRKKPRNLEDFGVLLLMFFFTDQV